jgi:ATP-dependent helicase HrpB
MGERTPLPIGEILPEVIARLLRPATDGRRKNLVIEAPPGAGKTTMVPLALLEAGIEGEILVLQPRRLAARMAAARVAALLGEPLGERVGYQVRHDARQGPRTQLRFMTEGILLRRLRERDRNLRGIAAVLLDEFHERHLEGELALALLRGLQRRSRPDLAIVAMSATLEQAPLARFLEASLLRVEGRLHPVEIEYRAANSRSGEKSLDGEVARALAAELEREAGETDAHERGHVLVFLPGMREIRACEARCRSIAERAKLRILPLHGELSRAQQDLAVDPSTQRKLILTTNVAETSITIEGVSSVIDSGLARRAVHDPWSGVARVELAPISRASAIQRAGRAGRTRAGRCLRLYSEHDFERRPAHDKPEIMRLDLSGPCLDLAAAGVPDPESFEWFEPPPTASIHSARALLLRLSAIDECGELTNVGRAMLPFPIHPRLARLLVEARERGIGRLGADIAALLSERPIRRRSRPADRDLDADPLADLDDLATLRRQPGSAARLGLDASAVAAVERARRQLRSLTESRPRAELKDPNERERALLESLLLAYPDRVARMREDEHGRRTAFLAGGTFAPLSDASVVRSADWIVALAVEERREGGKQRRQVTAASAIDPDWLIDHFADGVVDVQKIRFDAKRERIVATSQLRYDGLVLESSDLRSLPEGSSDLLADAAEATGAASLCGDAALSSLRNRVALLSRAGILDTPLEGEALDRSIMATIRSLCVGLGSFEELRNLQPLSHWRANQGEELSKIDTLLPKAIRLANGRSLPIHYEADRDPWVASRLQDFFGSDEAPTLLGGRLPIVLHLRAPNNRDVQVTTDLASFWDEHYPGLRRTLMRRYPRHDWPEDPRTASPPPARGGRARRPTKGRR